MSREYRYRKHIRWSLYYIVPFITITGLAAVWFVILKLASFQDASFEDLILDGISLSGLVLLYGLILGYVFYRLTRVRVSISEGTIRYIHHGGEIRIRAEEITKIQFPSLPYMGGWIKIVTGSSVIRLTVVVEEIGEFLKELKDLLDRTGNSHRYDRKKLFNFTKTATYADQSWARLYSAFGMIIGSIFLFDLLGLIPGMLVGLHFIVLALLLGITTFVPIICFVSSELWLARKFSKAADEERFTCPPRDTVYEQKVLRAGLYSGGLILGLILALIFTSIRMG